MKKSLMGAHVSFKKETQLLGTIQDLIEIGATSGGLYISDSRSYRKSYNLKNDLIQKAHDLANEKKFNIENLVVHAPIVGNISNTESGSPTSKLTIESYIKDINRLDEAGIKYYNFHPGSSKDQNAGIIQCYNGINIIHEKTPNSKTILLIETMMPKGNYIGKNFEQIKEIIDGVKNKKRIGVCFDTCHVWDAGYDIKNNLKKVIKKFDRIIGLKYLKALHINDSKNSLGSGKDRHEAIGKGYIGLKAMKEIINNKYLKDLPKVLETPYGKDDFSRWKDEINLLLMD